MENGKESVKRRKVSVVIPARNEEASIGIVLEQLQAVTHPRCVMHELIVVNNGSNDRTREVALDSGARVVDEAIPGYGIACLRGVASVSPDSDILLFLDADGSDNPLLWPELVAPILGHGAELVVGKGLFPPDTASHPAHARFGTWLITTLIRLLFSSPLTDLGPYRAITVPSFQKLRMSDTGCGWTVQMQIRAVKQDLVSCEVPVIHERRMFGQSKISGTVRGTIRAATAMFTIIIKEYIGTVFGNSLVNRQCGRTTKPSR